MEFDYARDALKYLIKTFEIKEIYLKGLNFHFVSTIKEVIDIALLPEKIDNPMEL